MPNERNPLLGFLIAPPEGWSGFFSARRFPHNGTEGLTEGAQWARLPARIACSLTGLVALVPTALFVAGQLGGDDTAFMIGLGVGFVAAVATGLVTGAAVYVAFALLLGALGALMGATNRLLGGCCPDPENPTAQMTL